MPFGWELSFLSSYGISSFSIDCQVSLFAKGDLWVVYLPADFIGVIFQT